jgi:phospholipid transport system substrate-binding protein|tara:strand:+ start:1102 stop:1701 length:600 start_codon:yes stop_codon:yes gene_type:complete
MMRNPILTAILGLFLLFGFVPFGQADEAAEITKMAKEKVNNIITYLRDTSLEKETRNKQIIAEVNTMFDFQLMAQLSLGKQWKKTKKRQRKEFVKVFVKRIQQSYLEKLDLYTDEEVIIGDAKQTKKKRAVLTTYLVSEDDKKEMIYKFRKHKKRGWLVYDVNILGVSFIQTYRSQFSGVLKNKSMDELIEDLKNPEQS